MQNIKKTQLRIEFKAPLKSTNILLIINNCIIHLYVLPLLFAAVVCDSRNNKSTNNKEIQRNNTISGETKKKVGVVEVVNTYNCLLGYIIYIIKIHREKKTILNGKRVIIIINILQLRIDYIIIEGFKYSI